MELMMFKDVEADLRESFVSRGSPIAEEEISWGQADSDRKNRALESPSISNRKRMGNFSELNMPLLQTM